MRFLPLLLLASTLPAQTVAPHLIKAHMPPLEHAGWIARLADLDGDGDLDVFTFGAGDLRRQEISVLLNDGLGRFATGPTPLLVPTTDDEQGNPAFADIDGDGDLDVIVPSTSVDIYVNDGSAQLTNEGDLRLGGPFNGVGGVAAGDIDNDGDVDLIFPAGLFVNDGLGSFQNVAAANLIGGSSRTPMFGDIDGDGDLDIVARETISINDGTGTFTEDKAARLQPGDLLNSVGLADFDGDGDLDILSQAPRRVLLNDGLGVFATSIPLPTTPPDPHRLTIADFDLDGDLDLAFRSDTAAVLDILRNPGNGQFVREEGIANIDSFPLSADTGDVDGNGTADIVFGVVAVNVGTILGVDIASYRPGLLLGDGTGSFARGVDFDYGEEFSGGFSRPTIADIDGDGHLDIYNGAVRRNLGNARFERTFNAPSLLNPQFADADGDGELDLFGRLIRPATVQISRNVGGVFSDISGGLPPGATDVGRFLVADVDHDGDPDIVTSRATTDAIFINDGTGVFTEAVGSFTPLRSNTAVFATADLNGDGNTDLLRTNSTLTELFYGDGTGSFTVDPTPYPGGSHVLPADFDADGDVDWVVAEQFQLQPAWLYRNDGGNAFTQIALPGGFPPKFVTDLDSDGWPDLVADHAILRNTALGFVVFTTSMLGMPENSQLVRDAGDLDGDGDQDFLILRGGTLASIGINRMLHLRSPFVPRVGGAMTLIASSSGHDGQNGPTTFAFLLGFGLAATPLPTPFGSLALEPLDIVSAGSAVAPSIDADASLELTIPNNPSIAGLEVFFQALALIPKSAGAELRLTTFTADKLLP